MVLIEKSGPVADLERNETMRKVNQTTLGSDIYARIGELPMNEADRQAALNALRQSEAIAEAMQPRHQPARGERRRRAQREHAAALVCADPLNRLHETLEALAELGQAGARGLRQCQRAILAHEQPHTEVILQRLDLMAHRRRRDAQLGGGLLDAQLTGRGLECP